MHVRTLAFLTTIVLCPVGTPAHAFTIEAWRGISISTDIRHETVPSIAMNNTATSEYRPAPVAKLDGGDPPPDPYAPESTVRV